MRKNNGFTLLEMMIAVTVLAVITAFAVPGFQTFQTNARITTLAEEVLASLSMARTQAAVQRRRIIWVRTANGWEVWRDATTTPSGTRLSQQVISQPGVTLQVIPSVGVTPMNELRFEATGVVRRNDTSVPVDVIFRVCNSDVANEIGRDAQINRLGRMFVVKHATSATCNL